MEIIPKGKNFRLVQDSELPEILDYLERYLPEALKVSSLLIFILNHIYNIRKLLFLCYFFTRGCEEDYF